MSELQIPAPVRSNHHHWRRTAIKSAILLIALVIWQGLIKRPTAPEFGNTLHAVANALPAPTGATLRVTTFNINGGVGPEDNVLDLSRTAKFLHGFDVAGMEEVHGAAITDWRDQAQILGEMMHMPWLFAPSERRWWHDYFGNGILCDLPVNRWERLPLSTSESESNRSMLRVFCTWHGHPLAIIVTHLDRHADHDIELGAVIASFYDTPEPAILLGDLNVDADPNDPQLDELRHDPAVTDALAIGMGPSFVKTNDWIFARGLKCVAGGLTDNDASDHKLAWAELAEKN
jgi:endonuclease/exonuclease/phosphatase family metal-dependent hydrolase